MNVDGILEAVDRAVIQDFSLPKISTAVQLKRLIIKPIRLLSIPAYPTILTIDGLDECEDFDSPSTRHVLLPRGSLRCPSWTTG